MLSEVVVTFCVGAGLGLVAGCGRMLVAFLLFFLWKIF
jgi:hypothetical protein